MILAITVPLVAASAVLMFAAAWIENRRDDRAGHQPPGPRDPVLARVTRAARHVHSLACRLPGATDIPQLRGMLLARGAFPSPPAAGMVAGEIPARPVTGHETPAAGAFVPGRDSPGTSPDVTGENAPVPAATSHPAAVANGAPPAGDLTPSQAIANGGELVTHPDPALWEGHRNIAPWLNPDSPWADEPGAFTAFITGSGEVA